jgi:hypothetical protein
VTDIDTLAATIRAGLDADEEAARVATAGPWRTHDTHLNDGGHTATVLTERDDLNRTELVAWLPTWSHEPWDERRNVWNNAAHVARNDPATVLARVARDRRLLDLLLAEKHERLLSGFLLGCPALNGAPCQCGRDTRVAAYLGLLAEGYEEQR